MKNLGENDWVAIYDSNKRFLKVARIDHKITLIGEEAATYKRNFIELLFIRIKDRMNRLIESDSVKYEYLIIDAETGKELEGRHHLVIDKIPDFHNIVFETTGKTWYEEIEKQKLIYLLNDTDWKALDLSLLQEIKKQLDINFFGRHYAN